MNNAPLPVLAHIVLLMPQGAQDIQAEIDSKSTRTTGRPVGPIKATDFFRDQNNNPAGIRPHHAQKVIERSDRIDRYDLGDGTVITLAAEVIDIGNPYSMLVHASETTG